MYPFGNNDRHSSGRDAPKRSLSRARRVAPTVGAFLLSSLFLGACDLIGTAADGAPTILRFEVSPLGVTAGQQTTFLWEIRGAAGSTCTLDVDGDNSPDYTPDCARGSQRHTYSSSGSYSATLNLRLGTKHISQTISADVKASGGGNADPTSLSWRRSTPQAYGVAEAQGLALDGKLYSFGGFDSTKGCCTPTDRAFVFDLEEETWTSLAPMPPMNGTNFGGMTHAGIATDGQNIFFAGGYTASTSGRAQIFGTREVLRYDPETNTYSRLPDLPVERAAGQLEYYGGKLYYFGGTNQARTKDTGNLYILDLSGGATSWREGSPLPNPRNHLGGVVLGGKIYAIAGQHEHDGQLTTQADVHVYDPQRNSWKRVADLPLPLSHIADSSFALGGRLIVVGGEIDHLKPVDNVFSYNPKSDTWTELTPLPIARMSTVTDTINGVIISAGGSGSKGGRDTYIATLSD